MATEMRKVHSIRLKPHPTVSVGEEELALDEPLCIFVNGEYHVTLIATPTKKKELAVGFLISEGVISDPSEIRSVGFRGNDILVELDRHVDLREVAVEMMNLIVTACGSRPRGREPVEIPRVESGLRVEPERIIRLMAELNRRSDIHLRTGGTHAAMICSVDGGVHVFAEDVGRHNAVDKVIGSMALSGVDPGMSVMFITGRLSGEMVLKVARGGIPIVASMTVPLRSGIQLAEATGVTLASLGRGVLKVYSNPQRLT